MSIPQQYYFLISSSSWSWNKRQFLVGLNTSATYIIKTIDLTFVLTLLSQIQKVNWKEFVHFSDFTYLSRFRFF